MNVADRVKQNATATSDAVYVLGGAAETNFRTFSDGFDFPSTGDLGGDVDYTDVPILVETATQWQIISATVRRSSGGTVSILAGVVRESSTGSALGLTGGAACILSVVPSYWMNNLAIFGSQTHATDVLRYSRRPQVSGSGLMALGPKSQASTKHATAQGYNAYTSQAYERAMGCGFWPEAGDGAGISSDIIWQAFTTDATAEKLACYDEDGLISNSDRLFLDTGVYGLRGVLTAIQTATGDIKIWDINLNVNNLSGTPATLGTATFTETFEDADTTAWTPTLVTGTGPAYMAIEVTGEAAHDITWFFSGRLHTHVDYT